MRIKLTADVASWKGCFVVVTDLKIRAHCIEESAFPENSNSL